MKWPWSLRKNRKTHQEVVQMPSFEKIVDMLYDKQLDSFCADVVRVIYARDRSMRYVVLKDEQGLLTVASLPLASPSCCIDLTQRPR